MTVFRILSFSLLLLFLSLVEPCNGLVHGKCPLLVPKDIRKAPVVIAHRGASYHLPEHTLEAYRLALELGADYIEPDLVATKDGHLVAIHTMDLNSTTNVADVFPDRATNSSQKNNATGYWAYTFTLAELKRLKVHQRLPTARTQAFDGIFSIPTFQDILQLVNEWNTNVLPQFYNNTDTRRLPRAGMYVELKDAEWLLAETSQNIVDLFLAELDHSPDANTIWNDTACDTLKFNEYLVPPLVVQSFDPSALQDLHKKWTSQYHGTLPPPLVVLAQATDCFNEDFWFHMGEWRSFISGVGPDKNCLLRSKEDAQDFMEHAREHELVVHSWTERPELTDVNPNFANVHDELTWLFCHVQVDGVFSEHVHAAVVAAQMGCDDDTATGENNSSSTVGSSPSPSSSPAATSTINNPAANSLCYNSEDEQVKYVGLAAGIMGIFVGCVVTLWVSHSNRCRRRPNRGRQLSIPQHDDLELM